MLSLRNFFLGLLFTTTSWASAQMPSGEYLEAKGATAAVILAHSRAQGPDGQVVGPLRRAISKDARLHTLSLQLPVLGTPDYLAYAATFPDAYKTLQSAVSYLEKEKGVKRVYILGYSMGARMTTAFLATQDAPQVAGYIGVGVLEGGGERLDANLNIGELKVPVLDLYADSTPLDLSSAENRKLLIGGQYRQVRVGGANHSFKGYEPFLSEVVVGWLREQEAKR